MHILVDGHDTLDAAPDTGIGVPQLPLGLLVVAFHSTDAIPELVLPIAMHILVDGHDTSLNATLDIVFGLPQPPLAVHSAATPSPELFHPTAIHILVDGHDTPNN